MVPVASVSRIAFCTVTFTTSVGETVFVAVASVEAKAGRPAKTRTTAVRITNCFLICMLLFFSNCANSWSLALLQICPADSAIRDRCAGRHRCQELIHLCPRFLPRAACLAFRRTLAADDFVLRNRDYVRKLASQGRGTGYAFDSPLTNNLGCRLSLNEPRQLERHLNLRIGFYEFMGPKQNARTAEVIRLPFAPFALSHGAIAQRNMDWVTRWAIRFFSHHNPPNILPCPGAISVNPSPNSGPL